MVAKEGISGLSHRITARSIWLRVHICMCTRIPLYLNIHIPAVGCFFSSKSSKNKPRKNRARHRKDSLRDSANNTDMLIPPTHLVTRLRSCMTSSTPLPLLPSPSAQRKDPLPHHYVPGPKPKSVKTRHRPFRHWRDARVYGHTTTPIPGTRHYYPPRAPKCWWCLCHYYYGGT